MSCGYKIILPDLAVFNRHTAHCYGVMNSAPQKANSVCLSTTFIESENLTQKKRALGDNETWCTEHETHLVVPLKTLMGLFSCEWKNSLFACLFSYQFREFQTATVCLAIPVAKTNDLYPLPYCDPPRRPCARTHTYTRANTVFPHVLIPQPTKEHTETSIPKYFKVGRWIKACLFMGDYLKVHTSLS